ncbi:hypothetical protein CGCF413_v012922 [Colletotrichum fructicola]|nr:hypothetical protein CGCF413_v012922 [Colletotrichum fructicola]
MSSALARKCPHSPRDVGRLLTGYSSHRYLSPLALALTELSCQVPIFSQSKSTSHTQSHTTTHLLLKQTRLSRHPPSPLFRLAAPPSCGIQTERKPRFSCKPASTRPPNQLQPNMCEWYRRNYACGHHFTGASEWCYRYSQTQKRCKVVVTQVDYDASVCKSCMKKGHKTEVPWEHMIDRTKYDPSRDE